MQIVHDALQMGRMLQKKQTGLVHYCYQSEDQITHDTIPVLENALFALALFRSRLSDHVLEGKSILAKLLSFEVKGNFPVYLHDYPKTEDPYLPLRLLPIFFWIRTDFSHVIGDLKEKLEECMQRIFSLAKTLNLPAWGIFRLLAFEGKVGELPQTLFDWGQGLISLQIAEKKGAEITAALKEASSLWHPELSLYVGKAKQRHQKGFFPELTLFDLFMCEWQKVYPERARILCSVHLHGGLIRPFQTEFSSKPVPYVHFDPEEECPLWIAWEEHTFVLAKKNLQVSGKASELFLYIPEEEEMGVNFYVNYHKEDRVLVNGVKATTFQQGEKLEIQSKEHTLRLCFFAEGGEYFGHVLRGNRPAQHASMSDFAAYDWRIALRTVTPGKSPIRVQIALERQVQENLQPLPLHEDHCLHTKLSP